MLLQLFLVMLLSVEVHLAPVMEVEACNTPVRDDIQDEVDEILKEGLLNNTNNIDKIKTAFEVKSGQVKICVPLNYTIFCAEEECGDFNCSSGYSYSSIWTRFDTATLAGGFLFEFASLDWTVFGFEWSGACDLSIENTPVLNISVSSLAMLCGVDNWEEYINASLQQLTQQVPSFANISELASSHTADSHPIFRSFVEVTTGLACFLSIGVLITVYSRAKVVTQAKDSSRKPKAYFQFWAFHIFATSFAILTITQNFMNHESNNVPSLIMLIWVAVSGFIIGIFSLTKFDIETPTNCCRCCHGFSHCIVLWMSLCTSLSIICFTIFSIPTIILVYYLYPARTLLRLPLLTNAVLYINSLLALLLFQCERFFYPFVKNPKQEKIVCYDIMGTFAKLFKFRTELRKEQLIYGRGVKFTELKQKEAVDIDLLNDPHHFDHINHGPYDNCKISYHLKSCCRSCCNSLGNCVYGIVIRYLKLIRIRNPPLAERAVAYHNFYATRYNKEVLEETEENCLMYTTYLCHPIGTMILLGILILFVKIIHDLTDLHLSSVKDLNLNLLLTLAPTLLLLFVSWYKFDIFYDLKDEEEESKKEVLLKEILKQEKLILKKIHPATEPGAANEDRQPDASDTTQDVATGNGPNRQGIDREMSDLTQLDAAHTSRDIDTPQATGDTAQATRPEVTRAVTRDTGDVVATPIATETTATEDEATGSSETT